MHNVLGRLILWGAEILDRSLLTVPDVDEVALGHGRQSLILPNHFTDYRKA